MGNSDFTRTIPLSKTTKFIVDNRGRTAPTVESGIPLIATSCISNDRLYPAYEQLRFVSREAYDTWFRSHPQPGDIILTNKGSQNGAICLVPDPVDFVIAQDMVALRADERVIEPLFLFAALRSPRVQWQIKTLDVSGVIPHFKKTDFDKLHLPYPDRRVQKAIGQIYFDFCHKIELNRRMNTTLEAMARALFQSWFVDFDPVRAKVDGRQPAGLDEGTAALFPEHLEESSIGKKPMGWEISSLHMVLAILETGGRPKGGVGGIASGIPSIGAESIVSIGRFDFGKTKFVPVEFYEAMNKGHIESHDVLIYKDGGRPGEYEPHVSMFGNGFPFDKSCINEHVYRLRANESLSQEYLYFWLTSEPTLAEMRMKGTGVAIPGLNSTAVRSLAVLVPTRPVVDAFTRQVAPLVDQLFANAKQSSTLATLRDTLLPKLLSGELSVSNLPVLSNVDRMDVVESLSGE